MPDTFINERSVPRTNPTDLALPDGQHRFAGSGISVPRFPQAPVRRNGLRWSFIAMVVLPTLLGMLYYLHIAAPQYVTEAVVALRSDEASSNGGGPTSLVGALGPTAAGAPVTQSYGLVDYVSSAPAIEDVEQTGLDLYAILGNPRADFLAGMPADPSSQDLLRAWRSMVIARFELTRGVITLTTRAFTAEDSLALSNAVLAVSERVVNEISRRIASDAVTAAETQVNLTRAAFTEALAAQEAFRAESGVLDPARASAAGMSIEMQLRQDLAAADAQAAGLRASGGQDGPMMAAAVARARALRAQLADVERQTSRSVDDRTGVSWAAVMARNDALAAAVRIAELQYSQSVSAMQSTRTEAAQQHTYLVTYVRPVLATQPGYPNRWLSVLIVLGCALLVWAIATLLYHAVADQM